MVLVVVVVCLLVVLVALVSCELARLALVTRVAYIPVPPYVNMVHACQRNDWLFISCERRWRLDGNERLAHFSQLHT